MMHHQQFLMLNNLNNRTNFKKTFNITNETTINFV